MQVVLSTTFAWAALICGADARYRVVVSSTVSAAVDGRRARRDRGRLAVIDAVVDLLHEGHTPPTSRQVTERSGVSEATLFRYFETLDDLQRQAVDRFLERNAPLFEIPGIGDGELRDRVDRFAAARVALYDAIAPIARLGRARAFDHAHFAASLREVRARLADQTRTHFASELGALGPAARDDVVGTITTLTSFESWDQLRGDLRRTPSQIRRAWRHGIQALLH